MTPTPRDFSWSEHFFFLEIDAHVEDSPIRESLVEMRASSLPGYPKVLGSYPLAVERL